MIYRMVKATLESQFLLLPNAIAIYQLTPIVTLQFSWSVDRRGGGQMASSQVLLMLTGFYLLIPFYTVWGWRGGRSEPWSCQAHHVLLYQYHLLWKCFVDFETFVLFTLLIWYKLPITESSGPFIIQCCLFHIKLYLAHLSFPIDY